MRFFMQILCMEIIYTFINDIVLHGMMKMRLRIRDLREDNDLKQETVANMLHVKQATYSRYETGEINIPVTALIILAEYYNTSIDYLVGLTRKKKSYTKHEEK